MKIDCVKEKLGQALGKAEKIAGRNLALPVLSCLLLEAKGQSLVIKATNLDLGIEITLGAKINEEGTAAVSAQILSSFIGGVHTNKNISLSLVDGNLSVSTDKNKTIIKTVAFDDFPLIPVIDNEKKVTIQSEVLIKGIKAVWYSSAVTSMKPELSSVYIYEDGDYLVFAATDSFRLAEKRIHIKKSVGFPPTLIPFKNAAEIVRVFEDVKEDIEILFSKTQISLSADGVRLVSRVIDGTFPDYKQIIPKEFKTEVVVLKQDIINANKLANIFSDSFNQMNIKADPEAKIFYVKTKNADIGENLNHIDAAVTGESVDVNFNYKYIVDCLQSIETDSLSLNFNGLSKPMIMKPIGDQSFIYLVMPMNR